MNYVIKTIDHMKKAVGIILALMLAIMSVLIIVQVFTRFVIDYPLHWTEELARYLMIYSVFLGAALALRKSRLISIEVIAQSVNKSKQRILRIIVMLFSIVFLIILLVQGIQILGVVKLQSSAGLGISMAVPYASIPIGAALMIINAIAVIFETLKGEPIKESGGEI